MEETDRFTVGDADGLWDAIGADSDADLVEQAKLLTRCGVIGARTGRTMQSFGSMSPQRGHLRCLATDTAAPHVCLHLKLPSHRRAEHRLVCYKFGNFRRLDVAGK
jgi:hypothetical protein